jgi:hypothetical protein
MKMNPEFRRSLWLEITSTRLIGMPLVLLAAIFMAWLADGESFGAAVRGTSLSLFIGITFLWGMKQTSDAVVGEIRERTWDWQRMSAIGPWSLTWGKFFGSTVYIWYGGAICLVFMALSWGETSLFHTLKSILMLLLGALVIQGIGLLASLQMLIRDRALSRTESSALVALAFFLVWPMVGFTDSKGIIAWYGRTVTITDFILLSLALFLFWIFAGAYSLIRAEFRMRTLPYAWGGFVLFLMLYMAGFANAANMRILVAGGTAIGLTYLTALLEGKDPVALGRLLRWFREGNRRRVIEGLPTCIVTLPFVLVAALLLALMPGDFATPFGATGFRALIVAALAFLLRDIGLLLYMNLAKKPQRADMFMLLCLALLYGLLPAILQAIGAAPATAIFWPRDQYWAISLAASILGAVGIWYLAGGRWKRLTGES